VRCIPLLCLSILWVFFPTVLYATEQIAVIVANAQELESLSRADLARIYERRRRFWNDGARIIPINLPADHPLRRQFSLQVFNRPPEEMQDYWNTQYFHGVSPPYVLASEQAVLEFVANTPGAIGYVNARVLNGQVKVLMYLPLSSSP
jgi:ABC-type phosphate transport system substrate-binding protein